MRLSVMTVYVDNMKKLARVGTIRAEWSHLQADTHEELMDFAKKLGLKDTWLQHGGRITEHFDVTAAKRAMAISLGAVEVTYMGEDSKEILRKKLQSGLYKLR